MLSLDVSLVIKPDSPQKLRRSGVHQNSFVAIVKKFGGSSTIVVEHRGK